MKKKDKDKARFLASELQRGRITERSIEHHAREIGLEYDGDQVALHDALVAALANEQNDRVEETPE